MSVCDDCANFWNAFTSFAHWQNILYTRQQQQKTTTEPNRAAEKARANTQRERTRIETMRNESTVKCLHGAKKIGKIMRSTKSANINCDFSHKCMHNAIASYMKLWFYSCHTYHQMQYHTIHRFATVLMLLPILILLLIGSSLKSQILNRDQHNIIASHYTKPAAIQIACSYQHWRFLLLFCFDVFIVTN